MNVFTPFGTKLKTKILLCGAVAAMVTFIAFSADGFFHVRQKENGAWTFVDPDGKDFFLRAVDHVGGVDGEKKNGPINVDQVRERMAAWGFNTIGVRANSRQPTMTGMPWLCQIKLGATLGDTPDPERGLTLNLHIPGTAMPNVFRKDFEEHAFRLARKLCTPLKDDRQLVGYCLDNELAFQGRNRGASGNWGLFEAARTKPETNSAHVALMEFLAAKGYKSAENVPMPVREEFCRLVAHRYFDVLTRAVRAADPNHLILGCRFSAHYDWTEEEAGKFVDVITVNCYPPVDLDRGIVDPNAVRRISRIHEKGKKPVMVTEWSFPAADTGYKDAGPGAGQRFATQAQRTRATEIFARTMLAMPYLVGYSYFMWQDSPAGSREETNYGLLDRNGNPFPEITEMFARLHAPESLACARPDGADFSCDGKTWRLTTADGLEMRGVIGGGESLFRTKFKDVDFGFAKVGMVLSTGAEAPKLREGFPVVFPRLSVVKDVRFETLDGWRKSLRLTGEGAWNDQKFEIVVRAVLLEGAGKVRFEVVSIRNVGDVPLLGVRALLQHYPPFKKIVKFGRNIAPPASDLPVWGKPSVAEIANEDGTAALRCVSDAKTLKSLCFSLDASGGLHPDVLFQPWCEEGRTGLKSLHLAPGETYRPASPMFDEVELMVKTYNVRTFGATGDGKAKDTAAIQRALDACAGTGGRVVVPPGTYLIGSIFLGDATELHLEKGATLLGSPDLADYNAPDAYPQNFGSVNEGWSAKHLVLAIEKKGVSITGRGVIDGNGRAFFDNKPLWRGKVAWRDGAINARDWKHQGRPGQEIVFIECSDVSMRDVTLRDMTCWSCFFHGCENVVVGGLTIRNGLLNLNTDGIDIDSCRNVQVGDCDIETGDDAVTIRGCPAKLKDPTKVCENIRFSNIVCRVSADGIRVGVGDGTIRNAYVSDMKIEHAGRGLHVQCCYGKKPRKGVDISDVKFERITIRNTAQAILVGAGSPESKAKLGDIGFDRIDAESEMPITVAGGGETRMHGVSFANCTFRPVGSREGQAEDREAGKLSGDNAGAIRIEKADGVFFRACTLQWDGNADPYLTRAFSVCDAEPPSVDRHSHMPDRFNATNATTERRTSGGVSR